MPTHPRQCGHRPGLARFIPWVGLISSAPWRFARLRLRRENRSVARLARQGLGGRRPFLSAAFAFSRLNDDGQK
eukprot:scaffold11673_cov100-Isochrysis_galbana.AAC.2